MGGMSIRSGVLISAVMFALVVSWFWPALSFDLVWDDYLFLYQMQRYQDDDLWLQSAFSAFFISDNYFRPLAIMSFRLDYLLFGSVFGYHFMSLFYYSLAWLICAWAVYVHVMHRGTFGAPVLVWTSICALAAVLSFHPVNVESAVWVSCRFEVLFFLFSFLVLGLSLQGVMRDGWIKYLIVGVVYLAACLSKEMAMVVPALVFLRDYFFCYKDGVSKSLVVTVARHWRAYLTLVSAGIVYLIVRYWNLGYLLTGDPSQLINYGSLGGQLATALASYGYYFGMFLLPFSTVQPVYGFDFPLDFSNPVWLTLAVSMALFLVLSLLLAIRGRLLGVLGVGFFIALFPVAHIFPMLESTNLVQSRFMLLPSVLVFSILTVIFFHALASEKITRALKLTLSSLLIGWCLAYSVSGRSVMYMWSNNLSLWEWAYSVLPRHSVAFTNYPAALLQFGRPDDAVEYYERNKNFRWKPQIFGGYAVALAQVGRYDEAVKNYESAIALVFSGIESLLLKGVDENSGHLRYLEGLLAEYYTNLAMAKLAQYEEDGVPRWDDVFGLLEAVEGMRADNNRHLAILASAHYTKGNIEKAKEYAERFLAARGDKRLIIKFWPDYCDYITCAAIGK